MKKPLAALVLSAAAVAAFAVPAGAAVPDTKPTFTTPCTITLRDPTTGAVTKTIHEKGHASVWIIGTTGPTAGVAAKNPCSHWLDIFGGYGNGHDDNWQYVLRPGGHFNINGTSGGFVGGGSNFEFQGARVGTWPMLNHAPCLSDPANSPNVSLVYSYNHIVAMPVCPGDEL